MAGGFDLGNLTALRGMRLELATTRTKTFLFTTSASSLLRLIPCFSISP
jgi:hypothetical protein